MSSFDFSLVVDEVRTIYGKGFIPLHRPVFVGNEKKYLIECIDSNFVSSVGEKVCEFERRVAEFTGVKYAIATVNGTAALQVSLQLAGVVRNDEVITQALTFIATCNAVTYCGAYPVFVDVDMDTLGLSPDALQFFLENHVEMKSGVAFNKTTGRRISACVPMHTFGIPCRINEIIRICHEFNIPVVEDAAESLGSYVNGKHTGSFGILSAVSFNGNKIVTTGGGGMILTNDEGLAVRAKHITTTSKIAHPYEFNHDEIGYNFRLPNLNAALGCAQMEMLPNILLVKNNVAKRYQEFFNNIGVPFAKALSGDISNHWLNAIVLNSYEERQAFLEFSNIEEVMTRPVWRLMTHLEMFKHCQHDGVKNSLWLEDRVVNIPSSVPYDKIDTLGV